MSTIMHVDMDAFFAAVEVLDNPEYANIPLIIGGRKDSNRGVVSTCSYEARQFGIHSAMPIKRAVALCPHGTFIPGRMERYEEVSDQVHAIFPLFSPLVEPLSIDEAFLDMTGCEHFYANFEEMGNTLKNKIKSDVGITASIGIAPNKFLAKLASDYNKPDGLCVIHPHEVAEFLHDLPISKMWGVGKKSEQALKRIGIYKTGDLLPYSEAKLVDMFGSFGSHLYNLARGIDHRKVEPARESKSIGQEITFPKDYENRAFLRGQLGRMVEKVGWRLRNQELYARTVTLKVRFSDFRTITRSHTLESSFCDDDTIFRTADHLLSQIKLEPVRLLGVTVSNFTNETQLSLFADPGHGSQLSEVMDRINNRFASGTITKGRSLYNEE